MTTTVKSHHSKTMKIKTRTTLFLRPAIATATWLFALSLAHAAGPYYWDKNGAAAGSGVTDGGSYTWNNQPTGGQWVDGANTAVSVSFATWNAPVDVNFVSTGDAAGKSYTVTTSGGNMYLGALTVNSGNLTIDLKNNPNFMVGAAGKTWTVNDGSSLVIKKGSTSIVSLNGNTLTMDVQGAATARVEGFSGTGALTKNGTGMLTLSGSNTYSGVTTINAGMLVASNSTALAVGGHIAATMTYINDGATLALRGGISLDEHFHVWGSGVGGLGAVRSLSGNNALTDSPGGAAGYALRTNTTIGVDADTLTVSGFYNGDAGSYGITKVGAGTLVLKAASTYTGATTVSNGTLVVAGSISSTAGTTVTNGALFVNGSLAGAVSVASGATLGGTNTLARSVTLASGAILAPGAATNLIGTLTLSGTAPALSGRNLVADVSTTNGDCDKLVLSGAVDLTGLTVTVKIPGTLPDTNTYVLLSSTALFGTPTLAGDLSNPWCLSVKNNTLVLSKVVGTMISFF